MPHHVDDVLLHAMSGTELSREITIRQAQATDIPVRKVFGERRSS